MIVDAEGSDVVRKTVTSLISGPLTNTDSDDAKAKGTIDTIEEDS